jgi:Uma2 family endonuclease
MSSSGRATAAELAARHGEDARVEVIHGELVPKAMPRVEHAGAQAGFGVALGRRFHRAPGGAWPGGWWLLPELHVAYDTHEIFCHDLCGFRRDRCPELPRTWPVAIRPDWVLELVSPSHEKRDLVDKWRVLHASGVPYYWIAWPEERLLQVHRWEPAGYLCVLAASAGERVQSEPFAAVELAIDVLFGDADDEA